MAAGGVRLAGCWGDRQPARKLFHRVGGLKVDQARRLKELERENTRLRRAVADLTLEKLVLKEATEGNW